MRELREEVGVDPTASPRLHGTFSNFSEGKSDYIVVFVVEQWERRPVRSFEIEDSRFFAPDELPEDASGSARRRIAEYAAGTTGVHGPW